MDSRAFVRKGREERQGKQELHEYGLAAASVATRHVVFFLALAGRTSDGQIAASSPVEATLCRDRGGTRAVSVATQGRSYLKPGMP